MPFPITRSFRLSALTIACAFAFSIPALAQDAIPTMPDPIKNLVAEGAQVRYLGRDHGLDAWLTIKSGQEQYFYVMPSGEAFLMGVLFDKTGKLVTAQQVQKLRKNGDDLLDTLAAPELAANHVPTQTDPASLTPSERLYNDIESSNWIPLGTRGAPVVYSFIDPQCPHCHSFIQDLKDDYIDKGRVQVRMIPIGFKDETKAQAAFLLAAPNPQERWYNHLNDDKAALPAKADINQQGVERNMAVMQSWKFDVTPMIIYRGKDGKVKLVRGKPKDVESFVGDIAANG